MSHFYNLYAVGTKRTCLLTIVTALPILLSCFNKKQNSPKQKAKYLIPSAAYIAVKLWPST